MRATNRTFSSNRTVAAMTTHRTNQSLPIASSAPTTSASPTASTSSTAFSIPSDCCSLAKWTRRGVIAAVVVLVACSAYLYGRNESLQSRIDRSALGSMPTMMVDGQAVTMVDATAAVVSDKFSIATGPVADDSEGFFMLDHNSGLLQCQVIYPRLGQVGARFAVNVAEPLGTAGKGGTYLMLTGRVNFPRASNRPAASVVVYVMDTATGNFVCYGVPFNDSMVNSGRSQQGTLVLITQGSANPLVDRDALR